MAYWPAAARNYSARLPVCISRIAPFFGPFLIQMICATAAATCLAHRASGGALWLIPLAAFLLGLGLQEKLTFAWGYPQVVRVSGETAPSG